MKVKYLFIMKFQKRCPDVLRTEAVLALSVSIKDSRAGIADDDSDSVFNEFVQVGDEDKHNTGTGLGLSISSAIIECHRAILSNQWL